MLWNYLFVLADEKVQDQELALHSFLTAAVEEVHDMTHADDTWFEEGIYLSVL